MQGDREYKKIRIKIMRESQILKVYTRIFQVMNNANINTQISRLWIANIVVAKWSTFKTNMNLETIGFLGRSMLQSAGTPPRHGLTPRKMFSKFSRCSIQIKFKKLFVGKEMR